MLNFLLFAIIIDIIINFDPQDFDKGWIWSNSRYDDSDDHWFVFKKFLLNYFYHIVVYVTVSRIAEKYFPQVRKKSLIHY